MPGTGPWRYASIRVSRSCNTKQALEFIGAPSVALDGWTIRVQRGLPSTFGAYCSNAKLVDQFDMKSTEGDYCFVSAGPGAGMYPNLDDPGAFNAAVLDFLSAAGAGDGE